MGFSYFGAPLTAKQVAHRVQCIYKDKAKFDRADGRFYYHVEQWKEYLRYAAWAPI